MILKKGHGTSTFQQVHFKLNIYKFDQTESHTFCDTVKAVRHLEQSHEQNIEKSAPQ